jgi:glyoxylase-like metal-dependent hydrolase (beta-lactamase superfamily II)
VKRPKLTGQEKGKEPPLFESYPQLIEDNVYFCGYPSKKTVSCHSYLIVRPEGNILVDNPQPHPTLVSAIQKLGGIRYLFITHKDHVNHHSEWHELTGCTRIMHSDDHLEKPNSHFESTTSVEIKLKGYEPSLLDKSPDLEIIPIPGHTEGSIGLLYQKKFFFCGDALLYEPSIPALIGARTVCWYDWKKQMESHLKILDYDFLWVLPGHEEGYRAKSYEETKDLLKKGYKEMQKLPLGHTPILRFVAHLQLNQKKWFWLARQALPTNLEVLLQKQKGAKAVWFEYLVWIGLASIIILVLWFFISLIF